MKSLDGLQSEGLRWVQVSSSMFTFHWELHNSAGETLASMRRRSIWAFEFELDAVGNRWEFETKGWLGLRTEIRSVGTGDLTATYYSAAGRLEFTDGTQYHWKAISLLGMNYAWVDAEDEPVAAFEQKGLLSLKYEADVLLKTGHEETKSLPLLVFFGWYLMVLTYLSS